VAKLAKNLPRIPIPISSDGVAILGGGRGNGARGEQAAVQTILAQHQTGAHQAASAATKVLNPFDGQPPGYNYRGPNGAQPSPNGPALPPPPNNGSGSGGTALEYQPGRPGNYTRHIAVDVTELQNGNGQGSS
jgi:hypothetical protein